MHDAVVIMPSYDYKCFADVPFNIGTNSHSQVTFLNKILVIPVTTTMMMMIMILVMIIMMMMMIGDVKAVLESVRKHPTGWGGIYSSMLESMPSLDDFAATKKDEL